MRLEVIPEKVELGKAAAAHGATKLRLALREQGEACIVVATGASQFEMLSALVAEPEIDWSKVTAFHLDEYVGLADSHPASFRKYLRERFVNRLPSPLKAFHYINGEGDVDAECARLNSLISQHQVDVMFCGIGENGHLAFNDPPADFETERPYIRVTLDAACRRQQLGEGWFPTLADVPSEAISMSIRQIMRSRAIICTVPDARKAQAVKGAAEGPVTPLVPASILQQHPHTELMVDEPAAALLSR